ncbi:ABC transporter ATP-binding protein [Halodesulfurarchaeum sp.]|uniref:ABC transporter ATP-binding protein n=1 Tax=Halodesulfurarchaeum sp. TaxID=1980530 RepID=UPI002FC3AA5F
MALLSLTDLRKQFGGLTAVDDVSFAISDGEFVSILGPSGSGKSTILRMIAGFEQPTAGDIEIAGTSVVGTPPFERDVNMVFQDLALFPHFTVAENIEYGLKQRGVEKAEREKRAEEMLEMVRLEDYGGRDVSELSGGEQQRVALARAIVNEPRVVLFDEPLSSLDRKLRQHMQVELQRIQAETGITFLYVTHDQEVALSVSDRLIVLNEGNIEQIGSAEELYDDPASHFVADFIGDVNTLAATVTGTGEDGITLEYDGRTVTVPVDRTRVTASPDAIRADESTPAVSEGDRATISVRPHNIDVSDRPASVDADFRISGTVSTVNYQGSDTIYDVETELQTMTANVRDYRVHEGDSVVLSWDASDVFIFQNEVP